MRVAVLAIAATALPRWEYTVSDLRVSPCSRIVHVRERKVGEGIVVI